MPPKEETNATFLSFLKSISRPTMNKRKTIPSSESVEMVSEFVIRPRTGPMITPVTMYANINGCFRSFAIYAKTVANTIMTPMLKNKFSIIFFETPSGNLFQINKP